MKGHLTQAEAKLHWQSKDIHTEKRVVKKKKSGEIHLQRKLVSNVTVSTAAFIDMYCYAFLFQSC